MASSVEEIRRQLEESARVKWDSPPKSQVLLEIATEIIDVQGFAPASASQRRLSTLDSLVRFQQLHARRRERHRRFEKHRRPRRVVREVQEEGGILHLDAIVENPNGDLCRGIVSRRDFD